MNRITLLLVLALLTGNSNYAQDSKKRAPLMIIEQGSFTVGGTVITNPGTDGWRARLEMARLWATATNKYGGDATVVHLPEIGIKGNTHFPFSDLNNIEIADLMSKWLKEKGPDK